MDKIKEMSDLLRQTGECDLAYDEVAAVHIAACLLGRNHVEAGNIVCAALNSLFLCGTGISAQVVYQRAVEIKVAE